MCGAVRPSPVHRLTPSRELRSFVAIGANFAANRHLTFRAASAPLVPQLAGYAVAYAVGVAASSAMLAALAALLGHPAGALDMAAALARGGAATAVRFVLMRGWVFRAAGSA